ncbi:cobalt-precorrin-6A reductase [Clostridium chrysemydis]|uniref:cobalt-precorrin-6A reductase n=1 Tax=Clostridium chrysemydis TaxID=2665504 RepID=UPI0018836DE2|nr:cobalt-precorrin-6A reductase [Clostridium chrysemydis]
MILLVLGTKEGKEIVKKINEFREDIVISTSTKYGGELLKDTKFQKLNTSPLDKDGFKDLIKEKDCDTIIDATHPYAKDVSITLMEVAKDMNLKYFRFERKGILENYNDENIMFIDSYDELKWALNEIKGNVLNTTGSNNISKIESLNLENRIIHRILPSPKIINNLLENGIKYENIIGMKGPFGFFINDGIIKEYDIKALITKDSGLIGGTKEKIEAALQSNVKVIVINKPNISYVNKIYEIEELIEKLRL